MIIVSEIDGVDTANLRLSRRLLALAKRSKEDTLRGLDVDPSKITLAFIAVGVGGVRVDDGDE